MNWIEIPAGKYNLIPKEKKRSHCQIELSVRYVKIITGPLVLDNLSDMIISYHICRKGTGLKLHR